MTDRQDDTADPDLVERVAKLLQQRFLRSQLPKDEARAVVTLVLDEAAEVADYYAEMDYCAMHYPEGAGMAAGGTAHQIRQDIRALKPQNDK